MTNGRLPNGFNLGFIFVFAFQAVFTMYGCIYGALGSFQITANLKLKSK